MKSNLIERLNNLLLPWVTSAFISRTWGPEDEKTINEAIEALTPVLPEEVEEVRELLSWTDTVSYYERQMTIKLIERLARDNSCQADYITELQQRIKELEGDLKERIRIHHECENAALEMQQRIKEMRGEA